MHRRAPLSTLAILAALTGCQGYKFKQVTPMPITVVHDHVNISARLKAPDIMIAQDTSGSMCEAIQLAADGGAACLGSDGYCSNCAMGSGGANGSCASPTDCATKMQLAAQAVSQVLGDLKPAAGQLFFGLASFPNGQGCTPGAVQIPVGDATTTIPLIQQWYQGIANNPAGGTPTAVTLTGAVATEPTMANSDPTARKFLLLITDGLPNCDANHPCATMPWSDSKIHGCESPSYLASAQGGGINASPPAGCACSYGACNTGSLNFCCTSADVRTCLDDQASTAAVASLYAKQNIVTYVVGMGFDYTNAAVLDAMAAAGHGNATHYQADDPAQLLAVIQGLLAQLTRSCNYTLDSPPADPRLIEVTLDGTSLTAGDPNGYSFVPPAEIDVLGTACQKLEDGTIHNLEISAISN